MKRLLYLLLLISSSVFGQEENGTVPLAGPIGTIGANDTYPTHLDVRGKGGLMSVATTTARDAIPAARRKELMLVGVVADQKTYQLKGGITNANWEEFGGGAIDTATLFSDLVHKTGIETIPGVKTFQRTALSTTTVNQLNLLNPTTGSSTQVSPALTWLGNSGSAIKGARMYHVPSGLNPGELYTQLTSDGTTWVNSMGLQQSGVLGLYNSGGFKATITPSALVSNQSFALPATGGTFAMTTDISGLYLPLTGGTLAKAVLTASTTTGTASSQSALLTLSGSLGANSTGTGLTGNATGGGGATTTIISGGGGSFTGSTTAEGRGGVGGALSLSSGGGGSASNGTTGDQEGGNAGNISLSGGAGGTATGSVALIGQGGDAGTISISGGAGGAARGVNEQYGGDGNTVTITTGAGGVATASTTATIGQGGNAGALQLLSANGANARGTATATGGNAGNVTLSTGNGGTYTSTPSTGIGGNAGTLTLSTGNGGNSLNALGGNAGNIFITAGIGGTGSSSGNNGSVSIQGAGIALRDFDGTGVADFSKEDGPDGGILLRERIQVYGNAIPAYTSGTIDGVVVKLGTTGYIQHVPTTTFGTWMLLTASGNGSTTEFTFPHGLGYTPTMVIVTANSDDAIGASGYSLVSSGKISGSNIIIKCFFEYSDGPIVEAPVSGTDNLTWTVLVK